jgi:hypothetical protein
VRLQICHDGCGTWRVCGLSPKPVTDLPSLSASIDYARRECREAPATIELMIDGFYAVIHQEEGWPRQLLAPKAQPLWQAADEIDGGGHRFLRAIAPLAARRVRAWLCCHNAASMAWSASSRFIASRACATRLIAAPASGFAATKRSKSTFRSTNSRQ